MALGEVTGSNVHSQSWNNIYRVLKTGVNNVNWYPSIPDTPGGGSFNKTDFPIAVVEPIQDSEASNDSVNNTKLRPLRTRVILATTSAANSDTHYDSIISTLDSNYKTFTFDYNMKNLKISGGGYFPDRWGDIDVHVVTINLTWLVRYNP